MSSTSSVPSRLAASPSPALPAPIRADGEKAAREIRDALVRLEEIPDYGVRQREALKAFARARYHATSREVRDVLRLAETSVAARETEYGALRLARLAEDTLQAGAFGTTPLLAVMTRQMMDHARDTRAPRLSEALQKTLQDPAAAAALEMARGVEMGCGSEEPARARALQQEVLGVLASGFRGAPEEILAQGLQRVSREPGEAPDPARFRSVAPDSDPQAGILSLGLAVCRSLASAEGKRSALQVVEDRLAAGAMDSTEDHLALARRMLGETTSPQDRLRLFQRLSDALVGLLPEPQADFLHMARYLAGGGFSVTATDTESEAVVNLTLDKLEELGSGRPLRLVDDCLDLVNVYSDKLQQANSLHGLVTGFGGTLAWTGSHEGAVREFLEHLPSLADTVGGRMQLDLDFLNILSAADRSGDGTWTVLRKMYNRIPEHQRDIAAVLPFSSLATDPGGLNDRVRDGAFAPSQWKGLQDTVAACRSTPGLLALLRGGIGLIDCNYGHEWSKPLASALSFVLLAEAEDRVAAHPEAASVMKDFARSLDQSRSLSDQAAQDTLLEVARALLHESVASDPKAHDLVAGMDVRWEPGGTAQNRKLFRVTMDLLEGNTKGITAALVGDSPGDSAPEGRIAEEADYVMVGGVILPKRKD